MITVRVKDVLQNPAYIKHINAVYHDVECLMYDNNHPEIFVQENESWVHLLQGLHKNGFFSNKIELLDIGTGTGFVIDRFLPFIKKEDTINFLDISNKMLDLCKIKYSKEQFSTNYLQSDCSTIDVPSASIDIATINSVLHHLPNTHELLTELHRVVKPGGYIIIKHEPNLNFYSNILLRTLYKKLIFLRTSRNKIKHFFSSKQSTVPDHFYDQVVYKITNELKLDIVDLTPQKLSSIVDIQSPTAGGGLQRRGFDPLQLVNSYFMPTDYKLVSLSTYNYYAKISETSSTLLYYLAKFFRKQFPNDAYFFDVMVQKHENCN